VILAIATFRVLFSFLEHEHGGEGESIGVALAAFQLRSTGGVFANQFTFGFGAFGFVAFPVASGFFTNGFAFGFGDLTMGNAMGGFANSDTFRTIFHFTSLIGAHDLTVRSFTFNVANCVFGFLT